MKIAQIAPLQESVPPARYGGTELIVSLLTEELVRRGHEVLLFASGDSQTSAILYPGCDRALRRAETQEPQVYLDMMLAEIYLQADEFDLIHSHIGCSALPYTQFVKTPTVHTLHGAFTPDSSKMYRRFCNQPYISISHSQRQPCPELNYIHTIYNSIDLDAYPFRAQPEQPPYLAFVGRLCPAKGTEAAIKIALAAGIPLKMAGKVDPVDRAYYHEVIEPLLDGEQIQYLGEVSHAEKAELLAGAAATLFPIAWREPFGLVMIESLAVGTPVLATALGSVPEVIQPGQTGYVCQSPEELIDAIPDALKLNRRACRDYVASHFSVTTMSDRYELAYQTVLAMLDGLRQRPLSLITSI